MDSEFPENFEVDLQWSLQIISCVQTSPIIPKHKEVKILYFSDRESSYDSGR